MAYYDQVFYANAGDQATTGYYSVAKRASGAAVAAGQLVRQFTAPAVGSERVFVCIIAGTTAVATDATWVLSRGAKTVDGTVTWMEVTGIAAVNSDKTNTVNWTQAKAIGVPTLGTIIQRNSGASYQICTTAGTLGAAEPAFSDTAGVTTTETSATTVWTSLGVVANFTKGAAPHARLANACTANWFAPGNTVYVGDNHAESQSTTGGMTLPTLTQATMSRIICHNHSGNYPPATGDLATTATISTTGATSITLQANSGSLYFYGLTFNTGTTGNFVVFTLTPVNALFYFDSCVFKIGSAGTTGVNMLLGGATNSSGTIIWNNCKVSFAAAAQNIIFGFVNFIWQNTGQVLATGSTVPTVLIASNANYLSDLILEALDLSQVTSVFSVPAGVFSIGSWVVKDCKLNASVTFPTMLNPGLTIQSVRADGGATAYKSARYTFDGTETTETSITRVGGAADPTGQAQSRKIVTTANAQWLRPFKAEPYATWNPTTGANVTVTVCGTVNSASLPNNDDIWLEVEYLGSATFPTGTIVTTTKANLFAANAAVASDGSTWNGGGSGAGWSPFKLTTTLSSPQPGMAGYIHVRPRVAKPSATYYLDPQISLGVGASLTWSTTYSTLLFTTDNSGWNGYNLRQVVTSANLAFSGSQVRVTLAASLATGGFVIDFAEIGHAAASGDPYDFDGGQVPLTFSGGSSGCTVAQGATILSDAIPFNLDKTKNFVVAVHFSGASAFRSVNAAPVSSYYKAGASEVLVADVSSYATMTGVSSIVSLIEVLH